MSAQQEQNRATSRRKRQQTMGSADCWPKVGSPNLGRTKLAAAAELRRHEPRASRKGFDYQPLAGPKLSKLVWITPTFADAAKRESGSFRASNRTLGNRRHDWIAERG